MSQPPQPSSQGGPLAVDWDDDYHHPPHGLASPPVRHQSHNQQPHFQQPFPSQPHPQQQYLPYPGQHQQHQQHQQPQELQQQSLHRQSPPQHQQPFHNQSHQSHQSHQSRQQTPAPLNHAYPPGPLHSPPSHPPPQPPQQRLPRQRPRDLDFQSLNQSPRAGQPPYIISRTPTAPALPPSPFAAAPGQVSALRFARPPLSPLGAPTSTPASPRFTDFDAFAGSPVVQHRPYRSPPGPLSPVEPRSPTEKLDELIATEASYYYSDSSTPPSPENKVRRQEKQALAVPPLAVPPLAVPPLAVTPLVLPVRTISRAASNPHDTATRPEPSQTAASKAVGPLTVPPLGPAMAGTKAAAAAATTTTAVRAGAVMSKPHVVPRNSSIDSAVTALATRSQSAQKGPDAPPLDVAHLIKTAGSAEAAIQYLIKERQSQSQQNTQLWRLVDKQRAMILGLNKDLERALKDKERYRKKLKEVMASTDTTKLPRLMTSLGGQMIPRLGFSVPNSAIDSPSIDSVDSQRPSPIEVSMAPYPITPPADHPSGPLSPVAELLEGRADMPNPQDHAYDGYDHEAGEKEVDRRRKQTEELEQEKRMQDIVSNFPMAPLASSPKSAPSEPPKVPPPELPLAPPPQTALPEPPTVSVVEATPKTENVAQFPSLPARKPPPAPLNLVGNGQDETDSDLSEILEVSDIAEIAETEEQRGRRRTREDDDRERQIMAQKEAEARSLSQKSKNGQPTSPMNKGQMSPTARPIMPESLAGMLSPDRNMGGPLRSPGLPSSPRAGFVPGAPLPVSPRMMNVLQTGPPLSPRPPRQSIPMHPTASPPTAPATTSKPPPNLPPLAPPPRIMTDSASLSSPKSPNPMKMPASPAKAGEAMTDEPGVFKGFVTEEHPDLLLAPSALPAVQVKVASSRMKPSRASLISLTQLEEDPVFTLAVMLRDDPHELWRVEKDSASLLRLDHKMKQCVNFTAKTPERSLFSGHAPAKLDARRVALDHYLEQLLITHLDVYTALELCRYLSTNTLSPCNDDATAPKADAGSETTTTTTTTTMTGPGGRPVRNGYLTKRGKNFGGWKARYFVLDGPQLGYYETPGGPQLGRIKLQNAQIGKQSSAQNELSSQAPDELDNQYRHAFLIMEPKKKDSASHVKHVLCAESDRERDQWVEALLQWVDYKSSDEEDEAQPPKGAQEKGRRASAADHDRRTATARRRATKSMHFAEGDGLIGVSYDSTQAGAAPPPQGSTPNGHRRRASVGFPDNPSSGLQPAHGHDMPDATSWTNKMIGMGLAPANTDDKRHKKRSFFGFGPKVRSLSTDGHDIALFGDGGAAMGGNMGGTPPQNGANGYQGPIRAAFGATLGDAARYNPPTDVNVPLPAVVYRCIQYLDAKRAVFEEGIFRLSGSNVVIRALRERFNTEGDVNLLTDETVYDIHAVASLLKMYLRELPTTILTHDLHNQFVEVSKVTDQRERIAGYAELAQRLPQANSTLLQYLISFLIKIINHQDTNKMSVRNVGIVFSPTLNIPNPVFAALLQNYQAIFGIEPEDYELPTSGSDTDSLALTAVASAASASATMIVGSAPPPMHHRPYDNSPARPATAGTGVSPSRQRLIEAMERDHGGHGGPAQSHLIINMHSSRGSPSPPASLASVGSRQGYEPQYLYQQPQAGAGAGAARPSYDSSGSSLDGQQQHPGSAPAYEQAMYNMNGMNGMSSASRRRESAVMMGAPPPIGLNPQGSKSRLREETRF